MTDNNGTVELLDRTALVTAAVEDGTTRAVLPAAPEGAPTVRCRRMLTVATIPTQAVIEVDVGFRATGPRDDKKGHRRPGARIGDTTFEIRAQCQSTPDRPVWVAARVVKARTGHLLRLRGDLSHLAGEEVRLDLCVDAADPGGVADALWIDPRLTTSGPPASMPVTVELQRLCLDDRSVTGRSEPMLYTGMDEPYLLPIYVIVDGSAGGGGSRAATPGVRLLSPRHTHGNLDSGHLQSGTTIRIPPPVGRIRTSVTPGVDRSELTGSSMTWVGLAVAVLAEGATPTSEVDAARRALLRHVRRSLDGLLRSANPTNPGGVATLTDRLWATLTDAVTERTLAAATSVFSSVDPDRHLGSAAAVWSHEELREAGTAGLPFRWRVGGPGTSSILEGVVRNG